MHCIQLLHTWWQDEPICQSGSNKHAASLLHKSSIQSLDETSLLRTESFRDFTNYSLLSDALLKVFCVVFSSPITSEVDQWDWYWFLCWLHQIKNVFRNFVPRLQISAPMPCEVSFKRRGCTDPRETFEGSVEKHPRALSPSISQHIDFCLWRPFVSSFLEDRSRNL